jgi:hypothetical protein
VSAKIGPGESNLIASAVIRITGENIINKIIEKIISKIRFEKS